MRAFAPLAVVLLLAGCLASTSSNAPGDAASGTGADSAAGALLHLRQVFWQSGLFTMAAADAAPAMPDGFQPAPYDGAPGVTVRLLITLGYAEGAVADASAPGGAVLFEGYPVVPPEHLRVEDVTRYYLFDRVTVPDEDVVAWWAAAGFPSAAGSVQQETDAAGGATTSVRDERGERTMRTLASGPATGEATGTNARLFAGADGALGGIVDVDVGPYTYRLAGAAHLDPPSDSPPHAPAGRGTTAFGPDYHWAFRSVPIPNGGS